MLASVEQKVKGVRAVLVAWILVFASAVTCMTRADGEALTHKVKHRMMMETVIKEKTTLVTRVKMNMSTDRPLWAPGRRIKLGERDAQSSRC